MSVSSDDKIGADDRRTVVARRREPGVEADSVPLVAGRVAEKSNDDAIAENVVNEHPNNAETRRMIGLVSAAVRLAPVP